MNVCLGTGRELEQKYKQKGWQEAETLASRQWEPDRQREIVVVGWLLNVPATRDCISGTDLLRQFYVLPH